MLETINETADFIETRLEKPISTALILGSGLGGLTQQLRARQRIPYAAIPHFPQTTVQGHRDYLYYGTLEGVEVLMLEGRFHYYEGYLMRQVTFPVRVLHALGVQNLIVSNAAGGVNPTFKVRDLMLITDHINLFPKHPLRSQNEDRLGPRFVDLHQAYNWKFIEAMRTTAEKLNISLQTGVYVGTQDPTYETPSEHRYMRTIGGDAVGVSTVPEVIVANHMGMKVLGLSVITDLGGGEAQLISHEEVQQAAQEASEKLEKRARLPTDALKAFGLSLS